MSVLQSFLSHASRLAVADKAGHYTYAQILSASIALQRSIQEHIGKSSTDAQPRIAYACPRDASYVVSKTATWLSNGIGVPLAESYPAEEIRYALTDSGTSCVLTCAARASVVGPVCASLGIPVIQVGPMANDQAVLPRAELQEAVEATLAVKDPEAAGAFMIYTSGTTGRPKGVLTTHAMLHAQTHAMGRAWGWSQHDRIYSVLPLHHVHGIVAVVLTALSYGASVEFATKFDSLETWSVLTRPAPPTSPAAREQALLDAPTAFAPTLFMAVPTVYAKLLELAGKEAVLSQAWSATLQDAAASPVRLMVSGSAALPESIARQWRERTGHTLLERYGMTEFAMAISNPLNGERRLNSVGQPLPGYEARLVPETVAEGDSPKASTGGGELQIRGPGVFKGYWNKPEATAESFTPDGWFKTGDRAVLSADDGEAYYSIQGRISVDILKTNGYKVSALDVERELLEHSGVAEIAVLGLPDEAVGEKIAAVVVTKAGSPLAAMAARGGKEGEAEALIDLRAFASKVLAPYKLPTILRILPEIPRNAMGKVNKKSLRKEVFGV